MIDDKNPFVKPAYLQKRVASQPTDFNIPLKPLHIQAGLEPFTEPFTEAHAAHLLRRTRAGASLSSKQAIIGSMAPEAVAAIIDTVIGANPHPMPDRPDWADTPPPISGESQEEIQAFTASNRMWIQETKGLMMQQLFEAGFREKMTLFWHNHFVTSVDVYRLATLSHRYVDLMRRYCLGNFKDFVHAMGLSPAMLWYLNGNTNEVGAANENYARELMELFTMGQLDQNGAENYTQADIEEIARALTGYVNDYLENTTVFVPSRHDTGEKTFMGRTGNFGYDDVINILFEERGPQIANFICRKIYKAFVYDLPDESLVDDLAAVFLANNYEIAPVMQALLQSAHFFDSQVIGARIKSPVDLMVGSVLETNFTPTDERFVLFPRGTEILDQDLLQAPNVAGWPGHRNWVSTTTLPIRWLISDILLFSINNDDVQDLVPFARLFPGSEAPDSAFTLPLAIARHLLAVPLDELDIGEVDDPFGGDIISNPIPDAVLNGPAYGINLAKIFLLGVPWYEWNLDIDGANFLLLSFVRYLTQLPEFHLT